MSEIGPPVMIEGRTILSGGFFPSSLRSPGQAWSLHDREMTVQARLQCMPSSHVAALWPVVSLNDSDLKTNNSCIHQVNWQSTTNLLLLIRALS